MAASEDITLNRKSNDLPDFDMNGNKEKHRVMRK